MLPVFPFWCIQIASPTVLEAMSHFVAGDSDAASVLLDRDSGLLHAAGRILLRPECWRLLSIACRRQPGSLQLLERRCPGNAATAAGSPRSAVLSQVLALSILAMPRCTLFRFLARWTDPDRWRANYAGNRKTPSPDCAFALDASEPYLNLHIRQPIHLRRDGTGGFEDCSTCVTCCPGYHPMLLSDGSLLIFAQDQRSIRAGLSFSF